jgi:SAM-dependent methyltransferase
MSYPVFVCGQVSRDSWGTFVQLEVNLDSVTTAHIWPYFVHFVKRREREIPFLLEHLGLQDRVFDACLGSGATTIGLKLAGLEGVVSNDLDPDYIKVARKREREDQLSALRGFRAMGRKLIIDERNYPTQFLADPSGKDYYWSRDIVYCGEEDKVDINPIHISNEMVVVEYHHKPTAERVHMIMYPFKAGEMRGLLEEAGFGCVQMFGDYQKDFCIENTEFFTYVCE